MFGGVQVWQNARMENIIESPVELSFEAEYIAVTKHDGVLVKKVLTMPDLKAVAVEFGYRGDEDDFGAVSHFLATNAGKRIEDPGWFLDGELRRSVVQG